MQAEKYKQFAPLSIILKIHWGLEMSNYDFEDENNGQENATWRAEADRQARMLAEETAHMAELARLSSAQQYNNNYNSNNQHIGQPETNLLHLLGDGTTINHINPNDPFGYRSEPPPGTPGGMNWLALFVDSSVETQTPSTSMLGNIPTQHSAIMPLQEQQDDSAMWKEVKEILSKSAISPEEIIFLADVFMGAYGDTEATQRFLNYLAQPVMVPRRMGGVRQLQGSDIKTSRTQAEWENATRDQMFFGVNQAIIVRLRHAILANVTQWGGITAHAAISERLGLLSALPILPNNGEFNADLHPRMPNTAETLVGGIDGPFTVQEVWGITSNDGARELLGISLSTNTMTIQRRFDSFGNGYYQTSDMQNTRIDVLAREGLSASDLLKLVDVPADTRWSDADIQIVEEIIRTPDVDYMEFVNWMLPYMKEFSVAREQNDIHRMSKALHVRAEIRAYYHELLGLRRYVPDTALSLWSLQPIRSEDEFQERPSWSFEPLPLENRVRGGTHRGNDPFPLREYFMMREVVNEDGEIIELEPIIRPRDWLSSQSPLPFGMQWSAIDLQIVEALILQDPNGDPVRFVRDMHHHMSQIHPNDCENLHISNNFASLLRIAILRMDYQEKLGLVGCNDSDYLQEQDAYEDYNLQQIEEDPMWQGIQDILLQTADTISEEDYIRLARLFVDIARDVDATQRFLNYIAQPLMMESLVEGLEGQLQGSHVVNFQNIYRVQMLLNQPAGTEWISIPEGRKVFIVCQEILQRIGMLINIEIAQLLFMQIHLTNIGELSQSDREAITNARHRLQERSVLLSEVSKLSGTVSDGVITGMALLDDENGNVFRLEEMHPERTLYANRPVTGMRLFADTVAIHNTDEDVFNLFNLGIANQASDVHNRTIEISNTLRQGFITNSILTDEAIEQLERNWEERRNNAELDGEMSTPVLSQHLVSSLISEVGSLVFVGISSKFAPGLEVLWTTIDSSATIIGGGLDSYGAAREFYDYHSRTQHLLEGIGESVGILGMINSLTNFHSDMLFDSIAVTEHYTAAGRFNRETNESLRVYGFVTPDTPLALAALNEFVLEGEEEPSRIRHEDWDDFMEDPIRFLNNILNDPSWEKPDTPAATEALAIINEVRRHTTNGAEQFIMLDNLFHSHGLITPNAPTVIDALNDALFSRGDIILWEDFIGDISQAFDNQRDVRSGRSSRAIYDLEDARAQRRALIEARILETSNQTEEEEDEKEIESPNQTREVNSNHQSPTYLY